jgi:zinc transporter ZupT
MSFLTNASHTATAIAITDTQVWVLRKQDFEDLLLQSQSLRQAVKAFIQQDGLVCYLKERHQLDSRQADQWMQQTMKRLNRGKLIPSPADVAAAAQAHHGAPIAIWLGLLLDGIPESLVIGANLLSGHIGLSLIAGLFLSNYPEALSSSVGMKRQGIAFHIILAMWLSLMLITGGGALLGNVLLEDASAFWLSLMQGLAAGSMLTMLAETMLPEAYLKGGSMIGLSTLAGFLIAIFLRTLE